MSLVKALLSLAVIMTGLQTQAAGMGLVCNSYDWRGVNGSVTIRKVEANDYEYINGVAEFSGDELEKFLSEDLNKVPGVKVVLKVGGRASHYNYQVPVRINTKNGDLDYTSFGNNHSGAVGVEAVADSGGLKVYITLSGRTEGKHWFFSNCSEL